MASEGFFLSFASARRFIVHFITDSLIYWYVLVCFGVEGMDGGRGQVAKNLACFGMLLVCFGICAQKHQYLED